MFSVGFKRRQGQSLSPFFCVYMFCLSVYILQVRLKCGGATVASAHMIIVFECTPVTALCGKILTAVSDVSSLIWTSSPVQEMSVMRTHFPMVLSRPTMQSEMREKPWTVVRSRIVAFLILAPGPILQSAPMTTLGPS